MKTKIMLLGLMFVLVLHHSFGQTTNTSPLPAGETKVGGHLHVGAGNEIWTDANYLYFNYKGNATKTFFWNQEGKSGESVFTIDKRGFVGIGTSVPKETLTLKGSGVTFGIYDTNAASKANNRIVRSPSALVIQNDGSGEWESKIVFADNGNVGIGIAAPKETLTLKGGGVAFGIYDTNAASKANNRIVRSPSALVIQNDGSGEWNNNVVFSDNGNVGIGTNNTQGFKLAVKGKIGAAEIQVKPESTWPDYVFAPKYKLRSLAEVESFIRENKHLPEIPSEAEVAEEGIAVGEMNAKLLQKIEELTLYVIEMKKEIDHLKEENDIQRKEINKLKN